MDIIVGTAGHIDHGKTALVKTLTGIDADRLPEEKKRGITIDLGFAELDLGELKIGFVDVPGHEKFVKNMLAGASGIDLVLLIVAADEGVMPQTKEHFEICRLLEIKHGLIVLTKTDLVSDELLELARMDAAELVENSFLEKAPVVAVSSKTGAGLDELKKNLAQVASRISARADESVARLPVDRAFSVKGFGAVVTGTLVTGEISAGTELELLPPGRRVRVRGVQTYGETVEKARAGQRTAVNLGGIGHDEIERGFVLTAPGVLRPVRIFDAEVEVLKDAGKPLKSRQRVRVHLGTVEALARIDVLNDGREIEPGERDFVQIRLELPVVAVPSEKFILRQYSPQRTIAGGRVIDAQTGRHRRREFEKVRKYLSDLRRAEDEEDGGGREKQLRLYLEAAGEPGLDFADLQAKTGWRTEILRENLRKAVERKSIVAADRFFIARDFFVDLKNRILRETENFHKREPLAEGILRETLREKALAHVAPEIYKTLLEDLSSEKKIVAEKDFVRASSHRQELSADEKLVKTNLSKIFENAGLHVPALDEALGEAARATKISARDARKIFQMLINSGEILKASEDFYFSKKAIEDLTEKLKIFAETQSENRLIGVAEFKDIASVSRKYAIPLLEFLDSRKVTRRAGDKRIIL